MGGGISKDARSTIEYPLEHLVACHGRIEERLTVLEKAAAHLESRPDEARQALAGCFRYFESSGVQHTADEEVSVFPRIESRLSADDRAYLAELESQHREADRIYAELKRLPETSEDVARYRQSVARFCALYRAHIASENERLIAAARRVLEPEELAAISAEMKRRRNLA